MTAKQIKSGRFSPCRSTIRRRWLATVAICLVAGSIRADGLAEVDRLVQTGQLDQAVTLLRTIDEDSAATEDLTRPLAKLATALKKSNQTALATEFFARSLAASTRPAAAKMAPKTLGSLQLAAASHFSQANQLDQAIDALAVVLADSTNVSEQQKQVAVQLLLRVGSIALGSDPKTAIKAYDLALGHTDAEGKPTAMLGAAWAAATLGTDPEDAAKRLAAFVDTYPNHDDSPRAMKACAICLRQSGRESDAEMVLADVVAQWPTSSSAIEVVADYAASSVEEVPELIRKWILSQSENQLPLDPRILNLAIRVAATENDGDAWDRFTIQFASVDETGQAVADLLQWFSQNEQESDAERLAADLISPATPSATTSAAREASCRWAGRTERWSMLALASETSDPKIDEPSRSVSVERLFAEALMQTGQVAKARPWWVHLADRRHAADFATLLRCAEASTAHADIEEAGQRIEAARKACEQDPFRISLVQLLAAELAIRRVRFDEARSILESVVRASESGASLRGRAQWLIGETHFLQEKFGDAIEAYRQVEGIDPDGAWAAASLLQAGKSFEQLGRTRDATVCYSTLVSRFADTQHADAARRRMAAISPNASDTIQR